MKILLKSSFKFLYTFFIQLIKRNVVISKSSFYLVKLNIANSNSGIFKMSEIYTSVISQTGSNNCIEVHNASISNSEISITGSNNKLILESGVNLRGSTIHIRGKNCIVKIGVNTTFGGIRIVNTGLNNNIEIGQNCLFADFIELWASDTHSIFDSQGKFINPERSVIIEDNVWIGSHVKILKGVTIGTGAVVGMNALVTKDIEPKTLNIGNPSRSIKENISWSLKYENE